MSDENKQIAEAAVQNLLKFIGEDLGRDGLRDTPARVVRSLKELTSGYSEDPAEILSTRFDGKGCDEMIVVKDIRFWSLCEHHMLPFSGTVTVGYLPKGQIIGLSKIGRLVNCFARRLQVQENLTRQISTSLMEHLNPKGVGVLIKATHMCLEMRGVRSPAMMITNSLLGEFLEHKTRDEFLCHARQSEK